ncbi:MAG: DNA-3-methyladenine glycosylase [Bryobacteraceae bacterium]
MAPVKDLPAALVDPWPLARLRAATSVVPIRFYEASAIEVARGLLGCVLVHGSTAGMIVETEAYLGGDDLAAHTARGLTERTKVIFGPPGRAYVYFIYGMHECLNVVAEPPGSPGCVLIRAVAPLAGLSVMAERRHWTGALRGLTSGPGKLTQALGITRSQYGHRLDRGDLTIRRWKTMPEFEIEVTPRVGISECADWPLRFVWKDNPFVSRR